MASDLTSKNKKVIVRVNRDPNSGWDFTGAENEPESRVAARVNRATSIIKTRKIGNILALDKNSAITHATSAMPTKPSAPASPALRNNNFKLNF
jgi:hypothetical protein